MEEKSKDTLLFIVEVYTGGFTFLKIAIFCLHCYGFLRKNPNFMGWGTTITDKAFVLHVENPDVIDT